MKPGAVRYLASICEETGRIEITELVLRSSQMRRKFNGIVWYGGPRRVNYWVAKHKGLTWVKRSKSHGDWGWADSIPEWLRYTVLADKDQPGRPTKKGALLKLLASTRKLKKRYGDHDPEFPDELPYSEQIKKIQTAIKRLT